MEEEKKEKLEKSGWKVGTIQELLELTDEEVEAIKDRLNTYKSHNEGRDNA